MKNSTIKIAVENINQTYGFPLPNSKSRIFIKYTRPQTHEGSISVLVSGWITDINKNKFPFNGALVKSFGTNFKDISKDLTDSLENANEKSGNPIIDVFDFVSTKIIPSVPYDAMDDFFKGIKHRKNKPKQKQDKKNKEKFIEKSTSPLLNLKRGDVVKIRAKMIQNDITNPNSKELLEKLLMLYPDIVSYPYGAVYDSTDEATTVIFKNKAHLIIPNKYLELYENEKSETNNYAKNAYEYYIENRIDDPDLFDLHSVKSMINYKNKNNIPIDDIDRNLLKSKEENYKKEQEQERQKDSWIKNLFNKHKV